MRALFKPSFRKEFAALEPEIRHRVAGFCLDIIPEMTSPLDLFKYGAKKLAGWRGYFRIRIGDYRIGFKVENSTVLFMHVLHRKEIYKHFL
jgi:mRNA-degrading endonuclease RelE of RelBE toxin-antitoxin system